MARLFDAGSEIKLILADIRYTQDQIKVIDKAIPTLKKLVQEYEKSVQARTASILDYYRALSGLYAKEFEMLRLKRQLIDLSIALEIASGECLPASD